MAISIEATGEKALKASQNGYSGSMTVTISGTPSGQIIQWLVPVLDAPSRESAISRALLSVYNFANELRLRASEEHGRLEAVALPPEMLRAE